MFCCVRGPWIAAIFELGTYECILQEFPNIGVTHLSANFFEETKDLVGLRYSDFYVSCPGHAV